MVQVIPVVQVVSVVRMISLDDMHSEDLGFSWSASSNYQEKLRCHACDGGRRTEDGEQRKIEQYSDRPETAKAGYGKNQFQLPPRHYDCNCKGGLPVPRVKGYTIYHHHHGRRISMGKTICLKIPLWKATLCFACLAMQTLTCN